MVSGEQQPRSDDTLQRIVLGDEETSDVSRPSTESNLPQVTTAESHETCWSLPTVTLKWRCKMRVAFCAGFLIGGLTSALADPTSVQSVEFGYRSLGTCLASPEGFNSKLEPKNSGVAWTMTFASVGRIDGHGAGTEIGQAVDTASFGVGPRMHMPSAHAYKVSLTATLGRSEKDGSLLFRAGEANGTLTAGPYAGRTVSLSGFELKMNMVNDAEGYASPETPVVQTVVLGGNVKFERTCVMTLSTFPTQRNFR